MSHILDNNPSLPRAQHISVTCQHYQGGKHVDVPALDADHLSITLAGMSTMTRCVNGKRIRGCIGTGDVSLVPRGHDSSWTPDKLHKSAITNVVHVLVSPKLWLSFAQDFGEEMGHVVLRDDFATADPLVHQLVQALVIETGTSGVGNQLYVQSLEQTLGLHLLRHYAATGVTALSSKLNLNVRVGRFERTCDYIEAHLADKLSLEVLAGCENLSVYHFARAFKHTFGEAPHQYVIRRRVERAQWLLRTTTQPLATVAMNVGFANQSHLNRHFKRQVGLTPRQYQKQL